MKKGTPHHPKMRALARELDIPLPQAIGMLALLWDYAAHSCPDGGIGRLSDEDIAQICCWPKKKAAQLISGLTKSSSLWLEFSENFRFYIHDWHEHCEDTVHRKLARATKFFANGVMPKLTRLSEMEKREIEAAYAKLSDPDEIARAHNVRTKCAQPRPRPRPMPVPRPRTAPRAHGVRTAGTENPAPAPEPTAAADPPVWPETAAAVRRHFPAAEDTFVVRLVRQSLEEAKAGGVDAGLINDTAMANAVEESYFPGQRSAGAFLGKVGRCLCTWATTVESEA